MIYSMCLARKLVQSIPMLGVALLVGCSAVPRMDMAEKAAAPQAQKAQMEAGAGSLDPGKNTTPSSASESASGAASGAAPNSASQKQPQLVKRASLRLEVEDAIATVQSIRTLVQQQQGDVLNLQEQTLPGDGSPRSASLELRVPQAQLDKTLDQLSKLGQVENRLITAEDVSGQIVDAAARLRNLRKQEDLTLKIMERSGKISEVLEVSKSLATVRESIEQLDAQLQNLKTQVTYSTIQVSVAEPIATSAARTSLGNEMKSAWGSATDSVVGLSRGLLVLGLWLLAYSPYLVVIAAVIYGVRRSRHHAKPEQPQPEPKQAP